MIGIPFRKSRLTLPLGVIFLFLSGMVMGQKEEAFFILKDHKEKTFKVLDEKDSLKSIIRFERTGKESSPLGGTLHRIQKTVEGKDGQGKVIDAEQELEERFSNGIYYTDLFQFLTPTKTTSYKDHTMAVEDRQMAVDTNQAKGVQLPVDSAEFSFSKNGTEVARFKVKVPLRRIKEPKRLILGQDTMNCHVIENYVHVFYGMEVPMPRSFRIVDYYAPGIGLVRRDRFEQGKLEETMMIKNP